jgi:hypothetical protein
MVITHKLLREIEADYGFNRATLAKLGIAWPPRHGWKEKLIGKEVKDFRPKSKAEERFFEFG